MLHDFLPDAPTSPSSPKVIRQHPVTGVSCTDDNGIMDYFVVSTISKKI